MIPVRLELKNFMSYGEQVNPLEFTGIRLACLSGENGNGKSALLDAITWALWGEARAPADELIRLGTDEMRVTLDFEMNGDLYRVIRAKSKRSSGNAWEVYISNESGGFRPITGQGIRDTGRVIQRILRMDYKTFINSAYIQQGRADEFTKQTVADRKKILADILDLSRYDVLEQKAKDRRNSAEQLLGDLDREIGNIAVDLANEGTFRTKLAESKAQRDLLEKEIIATEAGLRDLQGKKAELDATLSRITEIEAQISGFQREIEGLMAQKAEQERRVNHSREILRDKDRILGGMEKLQSTRELTAVFDRRLEELRTLEQTRHLLELQISGERQKLDAQCQLLSKELAELERKVAGAQSIAKDAVALRSQVEELDRLSARRVELEQSVTSLSDSWGALKVQRDTLKGLKSELEEKLAMISEPGARCPLCQTELGHEKHAQIVDEYRRQIDETSRRYQDVCKVGVETKSGLDAAQKEIVRIDERLKVGQDVRDRLAKAEQTILSADEYRAQIPVVQSRLAELAARLRANDFAVEAFQKLKSVGEKMAALAYDSDAHRRGKADLIALAEFESLLLNLKQADENLPADEANLRAVGELACAMVASVAQAQQSVTEQSKLLQGLPSVVDKLSSISASLHSLRENDRTLTGEIAMFEQSIARCESLRADVASKRKVLEAAKRDRAIYSELVAAFGKKGVQALIIENAIPEIQEEANRLLARMTDNAMQVSIETVRDKKTGGTAETLDIRISDDMGTRSYELFSGGEAFRVNFALRIALSKLLSRRAGARLQTLIIDEGFGTQDGKGREKLVEAIDSIKDDFEKILVITHIDELKDAFPTRIEITKDSQGSQISVD